jgi:segregation and condensation protein B
MNSELQSSRIKSILESLLFVARKPLSLEEIEKVLKPEEGRGIMFTKELIVSLLEEMIGEYSGRGINIVKVAGGYLMVTHPDNADFVYNLLHARVQTTLTPQALETLSIIAYKQPVTKVEVERIRGVNSDGPVDTLLNKKMIRELGRSEVVGRPYLYATTTEFLRHFGLKDLSDLPPLPISKEEQETLFKSALQGKEELQAEETITEAAAVNAEGERTELIVSTDEPLPEEQVVASPEISTEELRPGP